MGQVRRDLKVVLGIFVAIVVGFSTLACEALSLATKVAPQVIGEAPSPIPLDQGQRTPSGESVSSTPASGSQSTSDFKVGDIIQIGDIAFAVLGWNIIESQEYMEPDPGNVFVGVDVVMINLGTESREWMMISVLLSDGSGEVYGWDSMAHVLSGKAGPFGELAPKERVRGTVGFQVPQDQLNTLVVVLEGYIWVDQDGNLMADETVTVDLLGEPISLDPPAPFACESDLVVHSTGEVVEGGNLSIAVLGWELIPHDEQDYLQEGFVCLAVEVLMANMGDSQDWINSSDQFALKDHTGQRYEIDIGIESKLYFMQRFEPDGDLQPGERLRGTLGFAVPEDKIGALVLDVDVDHLATSGKVFFDLGTVPFMVDGPIQLPGERILDTYALGDVIETGDLVLAVIGWDQYPISLDPPGMYVEVELILLNRDSKPELISPDTQMAVKDSRGCTYLPTIFNTRERAGSDLDEVEGELKPGQQVHGIVSIGVSSESQGDFVFEFEPYTGERVLVFLGSEPYTVDPPPALPLP